jgi:hypothetical protein
MTCEEIRTQMENGGKTREFWSDARFAAHLRSCAGCSQFVEQRQSLRKSLELVRESVGPVPRSLDGAVLAGYRRFMAEQQTTLRAQVRKANLPLRWGAVAALVVIASAIAFYSARKPGRTVAAPSSAPPSSTAAAVMPQKAAAPPEIRPARHKLSPVPKHPVPDVPAATRAVASIPDDFQGLMYCDRLSCDGAMDLIRVQLPSSLLARPASAFRQTSGPVNADVLIGPDGIARGIRIEEPEF